MDSTVPGSSDQYTHTLLTDSRDIRLLEVGSCDCAAGEKHSASFRLPQFALDDAPLYEALSYVWETGRGWDSIHINGEPLKVTSNCKNALLHLGRKRFAPCNRGNELGAMPTWKPTER